MRSRNSIRLVFLLLGVLLVSCTKELDIDVNSSDPQIVVEANLSTISPIEIRLTESVNFDDDNVFPIVSGALITVEDDLGNQYNLTEIEPGKYTNPSLLGTVGRVYFLTILSNNKELSATSTIPNQVFFDSLIVNEASGNSTGGPGGVGTHEVFVDYNDPSNQNNYYRFVEFKNGVYVNAFLFDDRLTDGLSTTTGLIGFARNLNSGDTLTIEMQCVDKFIYEYYKSFENLFGGPASSSTPANPYTNIIGSKLGYFSAHTSQKRTYIVP